MSKLYSEIIYNKTVEDILEYLYLLYRIVVYVDDVVITGSDNMAYSNTKRNNQQFKIFMRNENWQKHTPETNSIL